jgi:hypothetical protein
VAGGLRRCGRSAGEASVLGDGVTGKGTRPTRESAPMACRPEPLPPVESAVCRHTVHSFDVDDALSASTSQDVAAVHAVARSSPGDQFSVVISARSLGIRNQSWCANISCTAATIRGVCAGRRPQVAGRERYSRANTAHRGIELVVNAPTIPLISRAGCTSASLIDNHRTMRLATDSRTVGMSTAAGCGGRFARCHREQAARQPLIVGSDPP